MIVTIHQPEHLPWLGFFNKLAKSELYVIMDDVQFKKNSVENRNKIIGTNGPQWIGIPVNMRGHISSTIKDMEIASVANPKWKEKYLQTIRQSYGKHPYFNEIFPAFEEIFSQNSNYLVDYNIGIILKFSELMGFNPTFVRSSELKTTGKKSDLVLSICEAVGATTYISGPGGREYMDLKSFSDAGIHVTFNDYNHPTYPQKRMDEFVPYMSTIDLLMNVGASDARAIIMNGNEDTNDF